MRYVDDFVLFSNEKEELAFQKEIITEALAGLRLVPHPEKTHIHAVGHGVPFLGFRVWPFYRVVKKERVRRFERYLRHTLKASHVDKQGLEQGLNSWLGHVRFGQHERLEYRVFWRLNHQELDVVVHPHGSWRVF